MCFFRKKKKKIDIQQQLMSSLALNGITEYIVERTFNKYGINNKNFKMDKYLDDCVGIYSKDTIDFCDEILDSYLSMIYRPIDSSVIEIRYLFTFTTHNKCKCSLEDCYNISSTFPHRNPSFNFHPVTGNVLELAIEANARVYIDSKGTVSYNLENLLWHLDDEKNKIKNIFKQYLIH